MQNDDIYISFTKHPSKLTSRIARICASSVVVVINVLMLYDSWEFHVIQIFACQKFHLF